MGCGYAFHRDMIMYGRTSDAPINTEEPISKKHFSSVVMAQMSAYCQRQIEAKLLRNIGDDNQQSEIFFILKQIMLSIDGRKLPLLTKASEFCCTSTMISLSKHALSCCARLLTMF